MSVEARKPAESAAKDWKYPVGLNKAERYRLAGFQHDADTNPLKKRVILPDTCCVGYI